MHNVFNPVKILIIILFFIGINKVVAQSTDHWEMAVAASDSWQYFLGESEPPSDWANIEFDASTWTTGSGGIGYGDDDDATVISSVLSVYIRTSFNIIDTSVISMAQLHVDYDDAFVAYLNGHEIARANIGTFGTKPAYNDLALTDHEAQIPSGGIPESFIIWKDSLSKYLIEGENILALQVHNVNSTSSDLSSTSFLTIRITDESNNYRNVPDWFIDPFDQKTNLPILLINTNGQVIVDEPKIMATLKVIDNGEGSLNNFLDLPTHYNGYIGVEYRGQSSQMFPKKGLGIETRDESENGINASLLGLPEEEDWILYAPYSDKSLLRNAITFHLGGKMGRWQPRFKFCDLYINNSYHGIYLLMEKIKRDKNRVDINKLNPDEISGDDLTGGYIVKVDKIWDLGPDEYFYTYPTNSYNDARNYAFTYVYPKAEDIVDQQKSYINAFLTQFENALNGDNFKDQVYGYQRYIDIPSFIDFQIMNELSNNVDGYRYSCFFHKNKDSDGGKLVAGPLWDFNLGYGNVDYSPLNLATDQWLYPNYGATENYPMHWWARLMEDEYYRDLLYTRWQSLREGPFHTDSIMNYLNDTVSYLGDAIARNFERWPVLGSYVWPNYFVGTTYEQELNYLKTWINDRLEWMDANIGQVSKVSFIENKKTNISVYPNPISRSFNIQFFTNKNEQVSIVISDLLGKNIFQSSHNISNIGIQNISMNKLNLKQGYYILKIKQDTRFIGAKKIIIRE